MRRACIAWGVALMSALGAARTAAAAVPGENLFKWGEYDSLIRVLEPRVEAGEPHTQEDSLDRAKSLLFLGVAFCATGKPERADEAFSQAVELDPKVELDRFYVTEQIANRFQATALRALRRHPELSVAALHASAAPTEPPRPVPVIAAPARHHAWVWMGMGTAAAITVVAGGYYFLADHGGRTRDDVTPIDLTAP